MLEDLYKLNDTMSKFMINFLVDWELISAEEELKRELQKIAEYFKIPACFLEAIPVKKDLEDDIFHNNGEKENEESTT